MLVRWIWRDLTSNWRWVFLLILNLSLGMLGLICIENVKQSINVSIQQKSKDFLTADIAVTARQEMSEEKRKEIQKFIGEQTPFIHTRSVFSMAAFKDQSRLVQLRQVAEGYPFYGVIQTEKSGDVNAQKLEPLLNSDKAVWVFPEVLTQLNVKVGDTIRIGNADFVIEDTVKNDVGVGFGFSGMAPKVYMGPKAVLRAQILAEKGSTVWNEYLIKLPADDLAPWIEGIRKILDNPAFRVLSHEKSTEQSARTLSYLNDYMGLVSLVALFLSLLGCVYLMRSHWQSQIKNFAVYRSLGLRRSRLFLLLSLESLILGATAALFAYAVSVLFLPLMSLMIREFSPFELQIWPRLRTLVEAVVIGSSFCFLVVLPVIYKVSQLKVGQLLQESQQTDLRWDTRSALLWLPILVMTWGLSVWQVFSYRIGSLFFFSVVGLTAVAVFLFYSLMRAVRQYTPGLFAYRMVLLQMIRQPFATLMCLTSLALGVLLVTFLQTIKYNLQTEVDPEKSNRLPSLFLLDIQPDQVDPLNEFLAQNKDKLDALSPFIRARLEKVNGQETISKYVGQDSSSREEEQEAAFRNREFNLSYRDHFLSSENLIDGELFPGPFNPEKQKRPYVSVETKFAERFGWKLGDVLEFDVQGVPVEAEILNFRSVRWTSFEPNFFIQFQTNVLEPAPKTFIGVIRGLNRSDSDQLQNKMARAFTNISLIDVSRTMERILGIIDQMSWAMRLMAALALIVGLSVFYAVMRYQSERRRQDFSLYKLLGVPAHILKRMIQAEFFILGLLAGCLGVSLSLIFSYILHQQLFTTTWSWSLTWPIIMILLSAGFCSSLATLYSRRVLNLKQNS